jgi:hypothetical protein
MTTPAVTLAISVSLNIDVLDIGYSSPLQGPDPGWTSDSDSRPEAHSGRRQQCTTFIK